MDSGAFLKNILVDNLAILSPLLPHIKDQILLEEYAMKEASINFSNEKATSNKFYNIKFNYKIIHGILVNSVPEIIEKIQKSDYQSLILHFFMRLLTSVKELTSIELSQNDVIVLWILWNSNHPISEESLLKKIQTVFPDISQDMFLKSIENLSKIQALKLENGCVIPIEELKLSSPSLPSYLR